MELLYSIVLSSVFIVTDIWSHKNKNPFFTIDILKDFWIFYARNNNNF
jgi:hypothetical protein